eukprot:212465_1
MEESYITTPLFIASTIITILNIAISVHLVSYFFSSDGRKMGKYFKLTASITVIFNSLNALFNSIFCYYFLIDPFQDDNIFYIHHPSHIQRITSTVSWYIGKVALIFFFSGRLYYTFDNTTFKLSFKHFICINLFNIIFFPTTIISAYWSVYNHQPILAEISFNSWRIIYQLQTFVILYLFSKRLLLLSIQEQNITIRRSTIDENMVNNMHSDFVFLTTKNAVLALTISLTVALTTFCFAGFRFIFGAQTRLTLAIPMNMAAIDGLITSISIYCLFDIGEKLYCCLCVGCNYTIHKILIYVSRKANNSTNMLMMDKMTSLQTVYSHSEMPYNQKQKNDGNNRANITKHTIPSPQKEK